MLRPTSTKVIRSSTSSTSSPTTTQLEASSSEIFQFQIISHRRSDALSSYKSHSEAQSLGLISTSGTTAKWGVGSDVLNPDDGNVRGRASVRLEGKTSYTKGLFVADIAHMPGNACGVWPSFWTLGSGTW